MHFRQVGNGRNRTSQTETTTFPGSLKTELTTQAAAPTVTGKTLGTIAEAVTVRNSETVNSRAGKLCECGCGRSVTGRQKLATVACRKRVSNQALGRETGISKTVEPPKVPGSKTTAGAVQMLINQIPPHDWLIEAFGGSGFLTRTIFPASKNTVLELDETTAAQSC